MSFSMEVRAVRTTEGTTFEVVNVIAGDSAPDTFWINGHTHDGSERSAADSLTIRDSRGYMVQTFSPYPAKIDA